MSRATLPLGVLTTNFACEALVFGAGERIRAEQVCAAIGGRGVHPTGDGQGYRIVIRNFPTGPCWLALSSGEGR